MSQVLIQQYLRQLATLKKVGGTSRESVVREAFKDLLKAWGRSVDLTFIPEYELETKTKERRYVDGALLHTLRVPFGYWEAKDEKDDLDAEIETKFRRGYPKTNIIFEDSTEAVLIQHGEEVMRCGVEDVAQLEKLLKLFFGYERPEIEAFRKAVEQFKTDLPAVVEALRSIIDRSFAGEASFRKAAGEFLKHAQEAINPSLTAADVREMLIQHILTGEVFAAVFPGTTYHEDNSVARELHKLEATFFTGNARHQTLQGLAPYYTAIRKAAAEISTHHQKQTFLKSIYENFYKVYNPKAADRLGVVYTPNEIVRFMIESADWLCEEHFGRSLIDKDVDILDPATGTGTFICELIEHFGGQPEKLKHKYLRELHANEVAILPYYVANLNIEATYAAASGRYEEFPGLCFVDTLDNTYALRKHKGHIDDLFGSVSDDNVRRIRQQNSRRISVIIGNPPYNANQLNENENNKNREYPEIDKRIKETYIAASTAQKTKLYDMYARFFRWAADRLDENGILAFITNRSFIESRTFDGFRAVAAKEFNEIRIVDLGGDVRANPKLSGTTHNVFGIQTGVAISFMVRKAKQKGCRIFYARRPEMETAEEKLAFLNGANLGTVTFEEVRPDAKSSWINLGSSEFDSLMPLATKRTKSATKPLAERAIFKLYSLGISTNRDEWIYGDSRDTLASKASHLSRVYASQSPGGEFDSKIKWSRNLKRRFEQGRREEFDSRRIVTAAYRPFRKRLLYDSELFIDEPGAKDEMFLIGRSNRSICFSDAGSRADYVVLAVDGIADLHFGASVDAYQQVPLARFEDGNRLDNITDWSLDQFRKHYQPGRGKKDRPITKEGIFHYVYGVLHDPVYREKYSLNLKREFPRIPFYTDFWQWSDWGKKLMDLHIGYESVAPHPLKRTESPDEKARKAGLLPKALLKADKEAGLICLDTETTLAGIPSEAWDYKLGNRSALEWVLDQYKEKTPKDPTIREKFNAYRFAEYKEKVINLLARVATVSVETQHIVAAMKANNR
ncbi:MAG: DNA methyltransferase [Betaproteobacteria bacterium RIFCSPLOWO2_02_FULL_67_19]|nr:MAG: DNA methyltransferase [Betaproteobacteria bacterium RIFCSPLOWO2_02_FULL_67_19]